MRRFDSDPRLHFSQHSPMTKHSRGFLHRQTTWRAAFISLFVLLYVAPSIAQTQATSTVSVDASKYVRSEMQRQHIPGVALLVSRGGKIVQAEGFGLSNVELQVPVKPETVFQSGSVGKQFTATAVMMLVEEGKVGLDDPLTKYFPDAPSTWKEVTVRELLSHTAGFGDYPAKFNFRKDWTEAELLKLVEGIPLAYPPGTKWDYSNLGFLTLGILIHRVTGEFYGDFLQQRIFHPLDMQTTRIISEADIVPNRAAGYRLVKGELKNQEWVAPMVNTTADGSLYFSILDLAKWDAALYTEKLLKALKPRPDVDPRKVEKRPTKRRRLRLRLGDRGPSRTPRSQPHRLLAGFQVRNRPLRK